MSKSDAEKYKPSLVYTSLLKEISKVRSYGIKKYGSPTDWLTTEPIKHLEACIRHVRAFMDGETFDKDSGFLHLAHAASNLMFEIERLYVEISDEKLFEDADKAVREVERSLGKAMSDKVDKEIMLLMPNAKKKKTSKEMLNLGDYLSGTRNKHGL